MSEPVLLPYNEPRDLDRDAWFLHETTSIPYYELCAKLCEEFAHFFNKLITGHEARGTGRVDYWVSRYLTHAENIRRGIGFVKQAGDYMPMHDFLHAPSTDFRGLIENAFGFETRDEWRKPFERMSYACGTGSDVLRNNEWKGPHWLQRGSLDARDRKLLDDSSVIGDRSTAIRFLVEQQIATPPNPFPKHPIDRNIRSAPGSRCPQSGVWAPAQWVDEGASVFSLAFCIEGRPMQPAYEILGLEKHVISEAEPEHGLEEFASYSPKTKAVDTTWYFVEKPTTHTVKRSEPATTIRLRCEANKPCPREGYWFTPAHPNSRRRFQHGEVMPEFKGDYGTTIWQWDEDESSR